MSVSKSSICFSKRVISAKWKSKLLIHNINLTVPRKCPYCLWLLVFLETWVIAPFWHWMSQAFPKGRCHHDLKAFWKSGYNNLFKNIIKNMEKRWLVYLRVFNHPSYEKALKHGMVKSIIFRKSSLNFSLGQGSYLISDFAYPNSVNALLIQVTQRSGIITFNNNFAFCQAGFLKSFMISFCSWLISPKRNN